MRFFSLWFLMTFNDNRFQSSLALIFSFMFPYIKNNIFSSYLHDTNGAKEYSKQMTQIFCSEIVDFKWQSTTANKPSQITHNLYSQVFIEQKKFIVFYWWTCYIAIVLCKRTHNRSLPNSMKWRLQNCVYRPHIRTYAKNITIDARNTFCSIYN